MRAKKKKIEQYRSAARDLENKVAQLLTEVEVKDEEIAALNVEVKDAQEKTQYFESELEDTKHELQQKLEADTPVSSATGLGPAQDFIAPEITEKITRLERENEALRAAGGNAEREKELERELEETKSRMAEIENDTHQLRRELKKSKSERAEKAAAVNERAESEIKDLEAQVAAAKSKMASHQALTLTVNKLSENLKKRETENSKLLSDKEKLESYTKKALHNVQDKYMLAIKTCKEQLKEKDERIHKLTDQYKQYRYQSQREAQLMSSAIYELGMNITEQRLVRNLDRSSATKSPGQSPTTWLQGQRDSARKSALQSGS